MHATSMKETVMVINPSNVATTEPEPKLNLLRRVFVPIERRETNGDLSFRTTDGEQYRRDQSGVIHRTRPKMNGKAARKARRHAHANSK